jgi:hypothetical protein
METTFDTIVKFRLDENLSTVTAPLYEALIAVNFWRARYPNAVILGYHQEA